MNYNSLIVPMSTCAGDFLAQVVREKARRRRKAEVRFSQ